MTATGRPGAPALTPQRLHADVAAVLGVDAAEVGADDDLIDQGMDSIRLMSLVEDWRTAGADTDFATLADTPTIAAWTALLIPR